MTAILFEKPLYLVPVLAVVLFVLLRVWAQRRTARSRAAFLVGVVVAPLLLVMQSIVVTDRERLVAICGELATAVERGDVGAIRVHVADGFAAEGLDKEEFLSAVSRVLTRVRVQDSSLTGYVVTFDGSGRAGVEFTASARLSLPSEIVYRQVSGWVLEFVYESDTWRIVEIRPTPRPGFPADRLRDLVGR